MDAGTGPRPRTNRRKRRPCPLPRRHVDKAARPSPLGDAGRDENAGHHPQQGEGDHPHALEIGELGFRALDFGLGGSRNPWHRDWPPSPLGSGPGLQILRKQTLVVVPYERLPIPTLEPTDGEMRLRDTLEMIDENEVDRGSP